MPAETKTKRTNPARATQTQRPGQHIYFFGGGAAEGRADMKRVLGGKGANLAEMTNLGIPVPPGFTISTEACLEFYERGKRWPDGLKEAIAASLARLETVTQKRFGDPKDPLLVSVRSGAAVSMPGMMDTILNLGLNAQTAQGLAAKTTNPRFAYDAYRRFIQMFGNVVLGIEHARFEQLLEAQKRRQGATLDTELSAESLGTLVGEYKRLIREATRRDFPEDPAEQLRMAIDAVFSSWNNPRAETYRNLHKIAHTLGTAVNIQAMVFGNLGETSATGVCFTRNPSTGEHVFYGEYLTNAQGEDVVAGIRTPKPIAELQRERPALYKELLKISERLERHYRDMQDLEFTIEEGKLYLLQTRNGKRTAAAAMQIATDMVAEGLIDEETALLRIQPEQLDQMLHPHIDPNAKQTVLGKGLPASPGAAVGRIALTPHRAIEWAEAGEPAVLVREETSPDDIGGMASSEGILTARGGMTSHAAVVGRGMGKPCVVGCQELIVLEAEHAIRLGGRVFTEGDYLSLNGSTGEVLEGQVPLIKPELTAAMRTLLEWADRKRRLGVRTNADTPQDAKVARDYGAEGIGLCRTEHMFFGAERLPAVLRMILAKTQADRQAALDELLPFQKQDFLDILEAMENLPVTIRLLDPPLHEFLPKTPEELTKVSRQTGIPEAELRETVEALREFNPMLGHRGVRLGITYPEIYAMQVRAIFEAACELTQAGRVVKPEVMIPLVGHTREFHVMNELVRRVADETQKRYGLSVPYLVGTMIEVPRAAVVADQIAEEAAFFSFGTNDLTQFTFGYSRDDIGKFLPFYIKEGILEDDPFVRLDQSGVGAIIRMAVQKGRSTKKELKVGICGEHGGESSSVDFCHRVGLDYVSCSPHRVPLARLAAAQAAIRNKAEKR